MGDCELAVLKGAFSLVHCPQLVVLALIANALYCAAYLAELFVKDLAASQWPQWRWAIWMTGTLFAILIESYWVNDEMIAPLMHWKDGPKRLQSAITF